MDSKNFAIGILSTTAVILFVGLVIINTRPEPAFASGMTAAGGGYQLTVGNDGDNDQELLYIVNASTQRLIVYRFDLAKNQIQIIEGIELANLIQPTAKTTKPKGKKSGYRGRRP